MYINNWVMIQDIGGSKGFRGFFALRVPFFALSENESDVCSVVAEI